jgi:segregation and condensation protein B
MEAQAMFEEYRALVQCLLFVSTEPITSAELAKLSGLDCEVVEYTIQQLRDIYVQEKMGLDIYFIDGGWQLCTRPEYAEVVERVFPVRKRSLSHAALETLSIIAYKQPVTRVEIEQIRGVKVEGVLQTLLERELIAENGRKNAPGKPVLYITTTEFLRQFNLQSLEDLPTLEELNKNTG